MIRTLVMVVLLAMVAPAMALEISWAPPTEREDGKALDPATEIAHYDLYCGGPDGDYSMSSYEIPGTETDGQHVAPISDILPDYGEYSCVMTATDTDGLESAYSQPVTVTWEPAAPRAPTEVLVVE